MDELYDVLLFGLEMGLFLLEAVKLAIIARDLTTQFVGIGYPWIRILSPDVKDRDQNVFAEVKESALSVHLRRVAVVIGGSIVHRIVVQSNIFTAFLFFLNGRLTFVDLLVVSVTLRFELVQLVAVLVFTKLVVTGIAVVAAFQRIGVNDPKLLVEYHPTAPLLIHILEPVLGLHVLPGEVALIELEIDAVVAQQLWE